MAGLIDEDGMVDDDGQFQVEPDADLRGEEPTVADDGSVEVPPDRQEKKRRRYDDLYNELNTVKSELDRIKATPPPQYYQQFAPPTQPQEDPEIAALNARMQQNAQRRREMEGAFTAEERLGSMTPQRREELQTKYRELETEHHEMAAERVLLRRRPSPQQQQQAALWQNLNARYPDIMGDTRAFQYASSLQQQEHALDPNKQFTFEDYDRFAEQTRIALGKKAPPVSDATKARFAGHSAGGNGAARTSEEFPARLDAEEAKMARSLYRELDERQAYAKFWREVKLPELRERAARKKTG